ncbi:MAG: hypothetical protein KF861_17045 [Planctomycetaceae bacterium]|nr:hypothetical protein [Planctomycetaceae bacterium]
MHSAPDPASVRTVDDLRSFVHSLLCARENLLADQFQTRVTELRQGADCCGLQFHLQGPRSVTLSAIWTRQQNVVYLYDARGQRYGKISLPHRPTSNPVAA